MIRVIPSISISNGRTAKLSPDGAQNARLFDQNPLDLAKFFEEAGAEWLHFVDLDGATKEKISSAHILQVIAAHTKLKVSFSGGIRTADDISQALKAGAKTVTVSTVAATNPELFMDWIITYGRNRLILGADAADGKIVTRGWQGKTDIDLWAHLQYFNDRSVQFVKLTDVKRDGLMEGPNFDMYEEAVKRFPNMQFVASGGVRSAEDIQRLNNIGVWGVIIARALYEDVLHVEDLQPFFSAAAAAAAAK